MPRPSLRSGRLGFGFGLVVLLAAAPARAQVPLPRVPDGDRRSGLLSRFVPIEPHLPPDDDRDTFATTRWRDHPPGRRINSPKDGGLYGRRYRGSCTACFAPYFQGSPGSGAIGPQCTPGPRVLRAATNVVHPFRPVGSYYAGGCFVPVYDLDPLVPGPGPFPWPHFFKRPTGG
jgi:hypothetical protein